MKRVAAIILLGVLLYASFSSWEEKPPTYPYMIVEYREARFEEDEYAQYQDFIGQETNLPEGFITADMLKGIGSFKDFQSQGGLYPLRSYGYSLYIENDIVFDVIVRHDRDFFFQRQCVIPDWLIGSSMLNLKVPLTGCIFRNGIMYSYKEGRLGCLYWTVDNVTVLQTRSFYADGEKYLELPEDSLIYRLLSASEEEQFSAAKELLSIGTQ